MCGIVGIVAAADRDVAPGALDAMRDAVHHRGPDSTGREILPDHGVAVAHTRLSVIDLSQGGHQPMWSADRSAVLVYNGEIYNYREVRTELESLGCTFASTSDTEVLIRGYETWGTDVLRQLNGMFAFAIWDCRLRRLWVVRDRLGVKPIYYYHDPGRDLFVFASELKAMLRHPAIPRRVDHRGFNSYLTLGYTPAPHTVLEGVRKLPAAHALTIEPGSEPKIARYWSVPGLTDVNNQRDTRARIRSLVEAAVDRRMISDVPIGAFLSGGFDSTLVVGLMSRLSPHRVRTFSAAFEIGHRSFKYNEDADFADRAAAHYGTEHTRFVIGAEDTLRDDIVRFVGSMDEPTANSSGFSTMLLAEQVKRSGVTVILTGDGSDELFGGYPRYRKDILVDWTRTVPKFLRRSMRSLANGRCAGLASLLDKANLAPFTPERQLIWWAQFSEQTLRGLVSSDVLAAGLNAADESFADVLSTLNTDGPGRPDNRDAMCLADLCLWIAEESNMRVDKATMSASVESRSPFLDYELVEYAMSIPFRYKSGLGREKWLLRRTFADVVPDFIGKRRKRGWLSPSYHWLRQTFKEDAQRVLRGLPETGLFDPSVARLADEFDTVSDRWVWMLYMFGLWHEMHIS